MWLPVVYRLAAIKGGVWGSKAEAEHPAAEVARRIVLNGDVRALGVDEIEIAVGGIDVFVLKRLNNVFERMIRGEEVVAVEDAHHVACDKPKSFVHRVVEPAVGLTDVAQPAFEVGFEGAHDLHGVVGGCAVDHEEFEIFVRLVQHRTERVGYCGSAVVGGGDDGDGHGEGLFRGASAARKTLEERKDDACAKEKLFLE